MYKGNLFIVSAPSGAGKTSLLKAALAQDDQLALSISHTTRNKRPGEENGIHYHFIHQEQFQTLITQGEFIEYAEVFGHFYGTSKKNITAQREQGLDVILEIDWQGAQQVRKQFTDSISIFILPPSREALAQRLQARAQDDEKVIQKRMSEAINEISHYHEADYMIINDDFDTALFQLVQLFQSMRLSMPLQQQKFTTLLNNLLQ